MNFFRSNKEKGCFTIFETAYEKRNIHNLSLWWALFLTTLVFALGWFTKYRLLSLPRGLTVNDLPTHSNSFIAERAWHDLNILTNFGPRPTGVYANEIQAIDFFKRELNYIQNAAHENQKIYLDIQKVSGAYYVPFKPYGMTNVYRSVQNVVVQLEGSGGESLNKNHTLMLNCHFDSVAGSPGASDDAASCCVMLEILRVLSQRETRLRHSVLFLFNGAEETPLQAAHGFITQHPWAKNIRAFLNLESVGSNGKEILFQAGPNHAWLIEMYRKSVLHPNGQVAGEELFQSGIVPSDTDFRIFRDFGHIPGMDFAHVMYGYRYHTKYDHIDYIPTEVLQRTGDNILSLVKTIANSDELANTEAYKTGRMVYFDLLGLIFVTYSESIGTGINIIVALASIFIPYYILQTKGINRRIVRKEIIKGFLILIAGYLLGNLFCFVIAFELDLAGKSMSWFQHTFFSTILYCFPSVIAYCIFYSRFTPTRDSPLSLGLKTQSRLIGSNIFWSLVTLGLTAAGYRTGYAVMIFLIISLVTNIFIGILRAQNSIRKWLYIHLIGQVFTVLWATHTYHLVIGMFIPIAGRSGSESNPDVKIGIICCFLTLFITSYLIPLIGLLSRPKIFLFSLLSAVILLRAGFVISSQLPFPYRDDANHNPTPQRHFITHALRTVYDYNGNVRYTDSGYYFREFDRNVEKTVDSLTAPETPIRQENNPLCLETPFCGLPFYSCRQLHTAGTWLAGPAPIVREEAQLKVEQNLKQGEFSRLLKISVNGSYLYSFQIEPRVGVTLKNWNVLPNVPPPNIFNGRKAYFVMVTHGLEAPPMNFDLEFKLDQANYDGPLVNITLVTYHWEYHKEHTPAFARLLARVPKWAFAVPSVASLRSWVF